jgi:MoaA/NifB/PqqE/SkfB family radical SAM enzyme
MLKVNSTRVFCPLPFIRMKIDPYGGVTQCCYQEPNHLGNILEQDFQEIWNSKTAEEIRKYTLECRLHPRCEGWGGCPFIGREVKDFEKDFPLIHSVNKYYPLGLELDLPSTHCNIGGENPDPVTSPACIMCPRNRKDFTKELGISKFDEILEKVKFLMPHLEELTILGVAEPFWKDALFKAFDTLDYIPHNDHCRFWTFTNGTIFGPRVQKKYMEYVKRSILNFSLDAATPETYVKIRRFDFYETIKENIKRYSARRNPSLHTVKICHVLSNMNFREMPLMVEEAEEMGADDILFNFVHNAGGPEITASLLITGEQREEYEKYEAQAKEIASQTKVQLTQSRIFDQM